MNLLALALIALSSAAFAETTSLESMLGACPDDGSTAPEGCTKVFRGEVPMKNPFELQNGDVITEVNGEAVSDPADAFKKLNGQN